MVFESVVVELLNRYLKPYVKKLDTSQLKVAVWKGIADTKSYASLVCLSRFLFFFSFIGGLTFKGLSWCLFYCVGMGLFGKWGHGFPSDVDSYIATCRLLSHMHVSKYKFLCCVGPMVCSRLTQKH